MHPEPDLQSQDIEEPVAARLLRWLKLPNIADEVDEDELSKIGSTVKREYETDKASRSEWEDENEEAIKLAKQTKEEKSYPWHGAANVKFPLIQTASQQFASRAYPAIVRNDRVVKANTPGADPTGQIDERGERVSRYMSHQVLNLMDNWEEDTDTLLHALPIVGNAFRKTYFDAEKGYPCSELVLPQDLVVNMDATDIDSVPRITQLVYLYPREIEDRKRLGLFSDEDYVSGSQDDDDAPECFLEQHRFWDLDGDDYSEPYVVTVHERTGKVARIVARYDDKSVEVNPDGSVIRIKPVQYYTHYRFLPSPDGKFYGMGYWSLLGPTNETINSTINQMLDAGHLANTGGGFIGAGMRLKASQLRFTPGEFKNVPASSEDIRKSIYSLQFPGPSPVLFQLLGLLIEAGKEAANVTEVLSGDAPRQNMTASATMALIEQGHRVYSAIFKRVYRSLKSEFTKLYRLNALYPKTPEMAQDFQDDLAIVPVADPNTATDMQRLAKAEALMQFANDPDFIGREIKKRYIDALHVDGEDKLWNKEPPPPDPMQMATLQGAMAEIEKTRAEAMEILAKIDQMTVENLKTLAEAEAEEEGQQLEQYRAFNDRLKALSAAQREVNNAHASGLGRPNQPGGVQGAPQADRPDDSVLRAAMGAPAAPGPTGFGV